eukprot:3141618-Rhodomonas_salina.1
MREDRRQGHAIARTFRVINDSEKEQNVTTLVLVCFSVFQFHRDSLRLGLAAAIQYWATIIMIRKRFCDFGLHSDVQVDFCAASGSGSGSSLA